MKTRKLAICGAILSLILAIVVTWSIHFGNPILVVVASISVFAVSFLLSRKDKTVRGDERIQLINEKSATATLSTYILGITLVGVVLLTLDNSGSSGLSSAGYTLLYSACVLLVLNLFFGIYYRRKYGG
ncbi:MAG: DUF2178 domain-containing protein [Candidatus Bathyarchaeota archaeon]|nr:DUF2178 domain-containing protein [Candidatus Bathyarchaeota archaeon]